MWRIEWDKSIENSIDKKHLEELVKKGPLKVPVDAKDLKKPEAIIAMLANPVYAGVPPYPALVKENLWIESFCKSAEAYGLPLMLKIMLGSLRQAYQDFK